MSGQQRNGRVDCDLLESTPWVSCVTLPGLSGGDRDRGPELVWPVPPQEAFAYGTAASEGS